METDSEASAVSTAVVWLGDAASGVGSSVQQGVMGVWDQTQNAARWTAEQLEGPVSWTWDELRAYPSVGGVLAGGAGLGAAMLVGVGELAVGLAIGYAGYLMLARGESPAQALRDALALEHGGGKSRALSESNRK